MKGLFYSISLTLVSFFFCCGENDDHSGLSSERYIRSVCRFTDTILKEGRDSYGKTKSPLFVDGLHTETLTPAIWKGQNNEDWILCNFSSQQPLIRLLDGLTELTGETEYRQAAEDATQYMLKNARTPNGFLYWGGHTAWDLQKDKPVGQYQPFRHEMKWHQPYYKLMWRVDVTATRTLLETIWAGHILDWSRLDFDRHAPTEKPIKPQWYHDYDEDIKIPFPAVENNLSFCMTVPSILHSGISLVLLDKHERALKWSRRLIYQWQQGCHPKTGLCGGQTSYRKHDRARIALGHVHPEINEAEIVASIHQIARYHWLPLVQMQQGERLCRITGKSKALGEEFIKWASKDLKVYAQHCYDAGQNKFIACMIDGTPINWQASRKGYYVPESFAPRKPDGELLWGYAMAYRLTQDDDHWHILQQLCHGFEFGNIGQPNGLGRVLEMQTDHQDWRTIYAFLELYTATKDRTLLQFACRIADNILQMQTKTGLFPRPGRQYARTGDEIPLALMHLAATIDGKCSQIPQKITDYRFYHGVYYGELEPHQQKRDGSGRTYDWMVFYGRD
jgi:pectate lyase